MSLVQRRPAPLLKLPSAEAWLVAGLLGAMVCTVAALFRESAPWLVAGAGCAVAGIAFYEPRTLGPLLVIALPLEITKLAFPILQTRSELGGGLGETSIVDAGRLVIALAFAVWLIRPTRPRIDVLPTSSLTLPLALLFATYACSTLWAADVGAARTETIRLLFSLGGFALVPFFVRDRTTLRWTLLTFVAVAGVLAAVGVWQQITGEFLWNEGLGEFGERRINTTFADPNHFARLLVSALVIGVLTWMFASRRQQRWILAPALALCALTLVFTGSRGAWIVAAIALPLTVLALPIASQSRHRILAVGLVAALVGALALAAVSPFFAKRLETATFGVEAFGARPYLVEAGLQMFADHPLTGVGAGGYQTAFEEDYYEYKDPTIKANVTASHTSAVTIPAELGLIGIAAVLFLIVRWVAYLRGLTRTADVELRTVAIAIGIASGVILLGSQTEGRFLEDPYLWLFAGLAVAIEGILAQEARERRRKPPAYLTLAAVDASSDQAPP